MKTRVVHLSLGADWEVRLKEVVHAGPEHRVLVVPDLLSWGPLRGIHTPEGMAARIEFMKTVFSTARYEEQAQDWSWLEEGMGIAPMFPPPPPDEIALMWLGQTAQDQLLLRLACAVWPDTEFWVADLRKLSARCPNNPPVVPVFCADALRELEGMAVPLSPQAKQVLADEWNVMAAQDHVLRICRNGAVCGVPENYFDAALLRLCTHEFKSWAWVVGTFIGGDECPLGMGDIYIFHRLHVMAQQGLLELRANDEDAWHRWVRKTGASPGDIPRNHRPVDTFK